MYLREVTAVGAKGLPDIWNRIEPDDVNSAIGKIHQIVCHVVEDHRVGIVQIPLERVERCHNDLIAVLKICVVPRRCLRKYLRKCLRIRIRNIPIVVKEISLLSTYVSGSCSLSPLMLFACVVHNKIQTHHHAAPVACSGQFFQIVHRSQIRTHLAEIRYRIASVALSFRRIEKRHQMQVVDPALFQIRQFFSDPVEVAAEILGVEHHAQHLVGIIKSRISLALFIEFAK